MARLSLKPHTVMFEKIIRRAEESSLWKITVTVFNIKKFKAVNL